VLPLFIMISALTDIYSLHRTQNDCTKH